MAGSSKYPQANKPDTSRSPCSIDESSRAVADAPGGSQTRSPVPTSSRRPSPRQCISSESGTITNQPDGFVSFPPYDSYYPRNRLSALSFASSLTSLCGGADTPGKSSEENPVLSPAQQKLKDIVETKKAEKKVNGNIAKVKNFFLVKNFLTPGTENGK